MKGWRTEILNSFFSSEEFNFIFLIPINIWSPPDTLVWHHKMNGMFSVRSVYYLARVVIVQLTSSLSGSLSPSAMVWDKLWKSHVLPKVKVCVWRLCNNFVPTHANLTRRHITFSLSYVMCNGREESVIHLSSFCPFTKCVCLALHWIWVFHYETSTPLFL